MKLTKSWLEDYIEIPFNIEELCHHLTMAGLEVDDVLQKRLGVMDASAIALARDNSLPIIVFSLNEPGGFKGILSGNGSFTIVENK